MTCTDLVTYRRPRIFGETFIVVARFTEGSYYHDDPEGKPDADVWIVKAGRGSMAREKTGKSWHVWIKPDFYKSKKQYNSPFLDWIGRFDRAHSKIGFCEGKPMTSMHHEIPICWNHEIPCKLFRVVHDAQPWGGTRARGFNKVESNPLIFQMQVQRHLHWACRDLSPFMSTTKSIDKAKRLCVMYDCKGYTGIQVLIIHTGGPAWEDTRIFHVKTLLERFDLPKLRKKWYFEHEWLIQDEIPKGQVSRVSFDQMMAQCSSQEREEVRAEYLKNSSKKRKCPEVEHHDSHKRSQRRRTRNYAKVDH